MPESNISYSGVIVLDEGRIVELSVYDGVKPFDLFEKANLTRYCRNDNYLYTLLLFKGYVTRCSEAKKKSYSRKMGKYHISMYLYEYNSGCRCVVLNSATCFSDDISYYLKKFRVDYNCIVISLLNTWHDGIYLFKDNRLIEAERLYKAMEG